MHSRTTESIPHLGVFTQPRPSLNAEKETILHRLFFYIEAFASNVSTIHFRLISEDQSSEPMAASISMEDDEIVEDDEVPTLGVWVFGRQGIKFEKPGFYVLQYSLDNADWHEVRKFLFPAREERD